MATAMRMSATRAPFLINFIRQAYHDLEILHAGEELKGPRLNLGLEGLREVIENINGDPIFAPAAEPKTFDVSKADIFSGRGFYLPWGPDVEEGYGFNCYPPSHILSMRGDWAEYKELGPMEYTRAASFGRRRYGYFIERTWPEYKLHFPSGLQDTLILTIARYPILIPELDEDALSTEEPFELVLPPMYNTLIRCRLVETLCRSVGSGFPLVIENLMREAESNIANRDYHTTTVASDFAMVGDDLHEEDYEPAYGGNLGLYNRTP